MGEGGRGGGGQVKSSAVSSGVITFSFCFERGGSNGSRFQPFPHPHPASL